MVPDARGRVIRLDAGDRRARREFDRLVDEARAEIAAATAGDLAGVYGADRALGRAVLLLLHHRWDAA